MYLFVFHRNFYDDNIFFMYIISIINCKSYYYINYSIMSEKAIEGLRNSGYLLSYFSCGIGMIL